MPPLTPPSEMTRIEVASRCGARVLLGYVCPGGTEELCCLQVHLSDEEYAELCEWIDKLCAPRPA